MMDYEQYDTTPCEEDCAQIGQSDYQKRVRLEFKAMKDQLIRLFGDPEPHKVFFGMMSNAHDFGTYWDFKMSYEEWNDYTKLIDKSWPDRWDAEAKKFLKDNGYYEGPQ